MTSFGAYAESLYQQVLPLHGLDPEGLAHDYVAAVAQPMREIDELVRDTPKGTGWSIILDVDDAPVKGLWWLSQLAGVKLRQRKMITGTNLAIYPDWEPGAPHWVAGDGATDAQVDRVAGLPNRGHGWRGRMTAIGAGLNVWTDYTQPISIYPGELYTISLDVIAQTYPTNIVVNWYDGVSFVDSTDETFSQNYPTRHVVTSRAPGGADTLLITLSMAGSGPGATVDFDALTVQLASESEVGAYLAGDQPGGSWLGTAHQSASTVTRLENDGEWGAYARDAIKRQGGKRRGTTDAILSAAEDTLRPGAVARLTERVGGNANALTLTTRPSETPDAAATLAAANAQKPFGKKITHVLTQDLLIDEESGTIDTATGTIDAPT